MSEIHAHDMVELAQRRVQHVADPELHPQILRQALPGQPHQRSRQVDRDDLGAAACGLHGQGPGSAPGV